MTENWNEADSDARRADEQGRSSQADPQIQDVESATQWFTGTAVRVGLTLIGVVILLFALGQAVGLPLLQLATEAFTRSIASRSPCSHTRRGRSCCPASSPAV